MFSNLADRVVSALRRLLGMPRRLVPVTLLGHRLQVVEGTHPNEADYDDAWFLACALHAEIVVDVGANMGDMALLALLCGSVRQIVLVDPNADALVIAGENLIRNRMSESVRFVCAFVSDVAGAKVRFWTVGSGAAGSMYAGHAKSASRAGQSTEVPTTTLDDIAASYHLAPDLVKVDVEGAEGLVLSGAKQCASQRRTRFLVEMHSNPELSMTANASKVLAWCAELGYSPWYLARGKRLESAEEIKDRGRCHLLLQPADWPYPEWLVGIPQSARLELALRETTATG